MCSCRSVKRLCSVVRARAPLVHTHTRRPDRVWFLLFFFFLPAVPRWVSSFRSLPPFCRSGSLSEWRPYIVFFFFSYPSRGGEPDDEWFGSTPDAHAHVPAAAAAMHRRVPPRQHRTRVVVCNNNYRVVTIFVRPELRRDNT